MADNDTSLPDTLNAFCAWFEPNTHGVATPAPTVPDTPVPSVTTSGVRSTGHTISLALHSSLEHLDNKDTYVKLLLINYSSTFNTIIPSRLISKLRDLGLSSTLCNWILRFLTHRPQSVRIERKEENMSPSTSMELEVEMLESIKFLGVLITNNLRLRKFGMSIRTLTNLYRCTTESIQSGCIMAWYGNCSAQGHMKLQKVACTAQNITEANLTSMDSIYMARCHQKMANIIKTHRTLVMTSYNLFRQAE
eukprot:g35904.t1